MTAALQATLRVARSRSTWLIPAGLAIVALLVTGLWKLAQVVAGELRHELRVAEATSTRTAARVAGSQTATPPVTPVPGAAEATPSTSIAALPHTVEDLRARTLTMPVTGVQPGALVQTFAQARGSDRTHEALDILAPRGTPVVAVEDGRIAKLFWSNNGGHTIYQFDPSSRYAYYYAHLERYADELTEGQTVTRGTVIGYVGSTGNADPNSPHLHFAIFELGPERQWWKGTPIDPYLVLRPPSTS